MAARKARVVREEHMACRVFGHAWDFTTVHRDGRNYVQGLRCMRPGCQADRDVIINGTTGAPAGNRYHYPPDYLIPGGLSARERARCRLDWCRGLRAVRDAG